MNVKCNMISIMYKAMTLETYILKLLVTFIWKRGVIAKRTYA